MYEVNVILFLLSVLSSFGLALWLQKIRKPHLELRISDFSVHNKNRMKITHIKVRNKPIKFFGRFMNRDFATNCRAHTNVRDASTGQIIGQFSDLKWASNPEPLKYDIQADKIVVMQDPIVMMTAGIKNIGERWEDLDIAVKHEGDEQFHINIPRNYPLNHKPLETRIDSRRCFIDVIVKYDNGVSKEQRFFQRNDSTHIMDFDLSETPFA